MQPPINIENNIEFRFFDQWIDKKTATPFITNIVLEFKWTRHVVFFSVTNNVLKSLKLSKLGGREVKTPAL